jgi:hydrogenase maturation protease
VPGILIIGYGNVLRGDDGVGIHVARELERQFHDDPEVEIIACQQLTPEMAEDISAGGLVIFLDAACVDEPGTVRCRQVHAHTLTGYTHHITPEALVSAAEQLYGEVPKAFTITLSGSCFDVGSRLSRVAQLRLPELVRQAREVITSHRKNLPVPAALPVQ